MPFTRSVVPARRDCRRAGSSSCCRARSGEREPGRDLASDLACHRPDPLPVDVPGPARQVAGRARRSHPACGRSTSRTFATRARTPPRGRRHAGRRRPRHRDAPRCPRRSARRRRRRCPAAPPDVAARLAPDAGEARALAAGAGVQIVCGRFEGVDERVIEARGLEEVSIGDYVLSGGEVAAPWCCDACVRLLPGVMGAGASGEEESFEGGLLEYPHYTRPRVLRGARDPRCAALGPPCPHRPLAPRRGRAHHARAPAGPVGAPPGRGRSLILSGGSAGCR